MKAEFQRLFQLHGLPKVIKSDNGIPFAASTAPLGLSQLSAWWVALGIVLEHSRPGSPEDNGGHERMHKDLEARIAATVQPNARAQQAALELWRTEFNHVRPHDSLQKRRPAELYRKSTRPYPAPPVRLDYGPGFFVRKMDRGGSLKWNTRRIFISQAIAGWTVGLRLTEQDKLEVWFNYLYLGSIDLKTNRFGSAPSRSAKTVCLAA